MPALHNRTNSILLVPTCGNCGYKLNVYITKIPILVNEERLMVKQDPHAIEPETCPQCGTYFNCIETINIEEE